MKIVEFFCQPFILLALILQDCWKWVTIKRPVKEKPSQLPMSIEELRSLPQAQPRQQLFIDETYAQQLAGPFHFGNEYNQLANQQIDYNQFNMQQQNGRAMTLEEALNIPEETDPYALPNASDIKIQASNAKRELVSSELKKVLKSVNDAIVVMSKRGKFEVVIGIIKPDVADELRSILHEKGYILVQNDVSKEWVVRWH